MPALFPADTASIVAGRRSSAAVEVSAADARTAPSARAVAAGTQRLRRGRPGGRAAGCTDFLLQPVIGSPTGPADAEAVAVQGGRGAVEVVGVLEHRGERDVSGVAVGERR